MDELGMDTRVIIILRNQDLCINRIELPVDFYPYVSSNYISDSNIRGNKDFDIIIHYFDSKLNEADKICLTYFSFDEMMSFLGIIFENL